MKTKPSLIICILLVTVWNCTYAEETTGPEEGTGGTVTGSAGTDGTMTGGKSGTDPGTGGTYPGTGGTYPGTGGTAPGTGGTYPGTGGTAPGTGGTDPGTGGAAPGTGGTDPGTGGTDPGTGGANPNPGDPSEIKHWHESGGFGTQTQGGLGGQVIKVTNLSSGGSGSLAEAIGASGKRLIVFEVGGVIDMGGSRLSVGGGGCTIAGQTAPSPGITITRVNFRATGSDIVVSHINVMSGDGYGGSPDTSNITGDNVVFDHVGVFWSIDENLSLHGVNNVTLYKSIIAEGLQYAGHGDGEHSKGSLINKGCGNLSLIGCLYAHNAMRNPRQDGGEILIANQVNYNWTTGYDEPSPNWFDWVVHVYRGVNVTFMGNVAIQGPESIGEIYLDGHHGSTNYAYVDDNIIIDQTGNNLTVYDPNDIEILDSPPIWCEGLEVMPAHESLYEVLRTVGPRPGDRDPNAARLVRTVADGNGEVIDSQNEVGGYPDYAPTQRPLTVPEGAAAQQAWLDELEDEIIVDRTINLERLYSLVGSRASDRYAP